MSWFKTGALGAAILTLAACGFQPIYSGGRNTGIQKELASIELLPIAERSGQILHNHLLDLLNPFGQADKARYELSVKLSESKRELAVQKTELATRANLRFVAQFQLSDRLNGGKNVFSGRSRIVASYNILTSDYAMLIAERNARRRAVREIGADIANRLAAFLQIAERG